MGLLHAAGLLAGGRTELSHDVVVVAAHDACDQPDTISTQQRDVVRILRGWIGRNQQACEQTVRGDRAYLSLLDLAR